MDHYCESNILALVILQLYSMFVLGLIQIFLIFTFVLLQFKNIFTLVLLQNVCNFRDSVQQNCVFVFHALTDKN